MSISRPRCSAWRRSGARSLSGRRRAAASPSSKRIWQRSPSIASSLSSSRRRGSSSSCSRRRPNGRPSPRYAGICDLTGCSSSTCSIRCSTAWSRLRTSRLVRGSSVHPVSGNRVTWNVTGRDPDPARQLIVEDWTTIEIGLSGEVLRTDTERLTLRWSLRSELRLLFELADLEVVAEYGDFRGGPPAYGREQVWVLGRDRTSLRQSALRGANCYVVLPLA